MCPFQTSDNADLRVSGARAFKRWWGGRAPVAWGGLRFLGKRHHPAFTCLLNSPLSRMRCDLRFSNSPHQHVHHGQGVLNSPSADTGTMAVGFLLSRTVRNEFLFWASLTSSVLFCYSNRNQPKQRVSANTPVFKLVLTWAVHAFQRCRCHQKRRKEKDKDLLQTEGSIDKDVFMAPRSGHLKTTADVLETTNNLCVLMCQAIVAWRC